MSFPGEAYFVPQYPDLRPELYKLILSSEECITDINHDIFCLNRRHSPNSSDGNSRPNKGKKRELLKRMVSYVKAKCCEAPVVPEVQRSFSTSVDVSTDFFVIRSQLDASAEYQNRMMKLRHDRENGRTGPSSIAQRHQVELDGLESAIAMRYRLLDEAEQAVGGNPVLMMKWKHWMDYFDEIAA